MHAAIPGFMDAMTMPYKLKNPGIIGELHPGDIITADVLVSQGADGTVLLDHIVSSPRASRITRPRSNTMCPQPGDAVPDFSLRNQDGRADSSRAVPRQDAAA